MDLLVVLLVTLLFGVNTFWRVVTLAVWGDELRTWRDSVNKPYGQILGWQHNRDHAPLGHLVAKASCDLFGNDQGLALRLPSWLFALGCVPLAYLLGRLALGRRAGLLMAVMVGVDQTLGVQATQARMYTQLLFWTLCAFCCVAAVTRDPRRRIIPKTAGLGVFAALALWSHFAALSLLAGLGVTGVILIIAGSLKTRRAKARCARAGLIESARRTARGTANTDGPQPGRPIQIRELGQVGQVGGLGGVGGLGPLRRHGELTQARAGRDLRRIGVALLVGLGIALLLSTQGVLKLVAMRDNPPLPQISDRDTIGQLVRAADAMIGNALLCGVLFVLGVWGFWLLARRCGALALLLGVTTCIGLINLIVASHFRQIEGPRYLLIFLPMVWLGIATANVAAYASHRRWLARVCAACFIIGVGFQGSRTIRVPENRHGYQFALACKTLPTLGWRPGDAIVLAPVSEFKVATPYYRLEPDARATRFLAQGLGAKGTGDEQPLNKNRRPTDLWMIAALYSRAYNRDTPEDGGAIARLAARSYGVTIPARVYRPDDDDRKRELSILHIDYAGVKVWSFDGTRR